MRRKLNAGNTNRVLCKMLGNNLCSVTILEIFSEKEDLCVFTQTVECTLVGGVPLNAFNSLIGA